MLTAGRSQLSDSGQSLLFVGRVVSDIVFPLYLIYSVPLIDVSVSMAGEHK